MRLDTKVIQIVQGSCCINMKQIIMISDQRTRCLADDSLPEADRFLTVMTNCSNAVIFDVRKNVFLKDKYSHKQCLTMNTEHRRNGSRQKRGGADEREKNQLRLLLLSTDKKLSRFLSVERESISLSIYLFIYLHWSSS